MSILQPSSLPEGYTYLHESGVGDVRLKVRIAEIRDENSARMWLEELQTISNVTWRIAKTYPHSGRVNVFRLDMRCQHNTDPRAKRIKRPHKHTGCPAYLRIVVKRNVKHSRSQNAAKNSAFPTTVTIDECHNHSMSDADVLKFRDMGPNTRQTLLNLFRYGHSVSSALHCLKTDLLLEHGDEYFRVAGDGRFVPSLGRVQTLYDKFKGESGDVDVILSDVNRLLRDYCDRDNGGVAKYGLVGDQCFVVICSPLMRRTHQKLPQAGEVVVVDAAGGGMRKKTPRVYVFGCPTAAGDIPLGVVVSSVERQDVFEAAVASLKTCFPEDSFYSRDCPKVFLTTSELKEQRILERLFPESIVLLCEFHALKAFWSWLLDAGNGISDHSDRQMLYSQFKSLVYAVDADTLECLYSSVVASPLYVKYPKFWAYLSSLWDLRTDWAQCYRRDLAPRPSNTNGYTDLVFRLVNNNIFSRARMFNLPQLVDFILTRYEAYVVHRLLDFCHGNYTGSLLRYMLPDPSGMSSADVSELLAEVGMFQVRSQHPAATDELRTVDIVRRVCSCELGNKAGKLCAHASAVLLHLDMRICSAYNIVSVDTKSQLFEIVHASALQTDSLAELDGDRPVRPGSLPSAAVPSLSSITGAGLNQSSQPSADEETNIPHLQLTSEEQGRLRQLFDRLNAGLVSNPTDFVPAVQKMLENIDRYAATERDLVNAIGSFGEPAPQPRYCTIALPFSLTNINVLT